MAQKPQSFPDPLAHVSARRTGAASGCCSAGLQFFGSTLDDFVTATFDLDFLAVKLFASFLLGLAGFAFFGGVFGHYMQGKFRNRAALFLMTFAIMSGGGTALTGIAKFSKRFAEAAISSAYAATEARAEAKTSPKACDDISLITVGSGLLRFLGLEDPSYRVVVGSFKRSDDARALISKINAADATLAPFVGDRAPCNEFYPVIVGQETATLYRAKKILEKAQKLDFITDAYISNRAR